MLHNVDSVVSQSVHLRTDDKSEAVKTEIIRKSVNIINVLAAWATLRIILEYSSRILPTLYSHRK